MPINARPAATPAYADAYAAFRTRYGADGATSNGQQQAGPLHDPYDHRPVGWVLETGERIGPPPKKRSKAMRRVVFVGLVMLGGAWALAGDQIKPPDWIASSVATTFAELQRVATEIAARHPASTPAPTPSAEANPKVPDATAMAAKPIGAERVIEPDAAAPRPGVPPDTAQQRDYEAPPPPEPLNPPSADPADPNQKRALAAGLHPQLSRVVLARLSTTDYRNVAHAVKTALAETPDTDVFVWPKQRKPDEALFNVRFVQGASADCRRYVVSITKDGWLTTALPMETCGLKPVAAKAKP